MNPTRHNPNILMIRPPFSLTGAQSMEWVAIKAGIETIPVDLSVHDAALDFFKKVVIRGDHLQIDRDRIAQAGERLMLSKPGSCEDLLEDFDIVNQALARLSDTFPHSRFHRFGFAHDQLTDFSAVLTFASDTVSNPFHQYANSQWQPFPASSSPDLAFIHIGRPGQVAAALTLAFEWQRRWPNIPLKLLIPKNFVNELFESSPATFSDQWTFEVITNMGQLLDCIADTCAIDRPAPGDGVHRTREFEPDNGIPLLADHIKEMTQFAQEKKVPLVVWRDRGESADDVSGRLYAVSRQGLWNHLILNEQSQEDLRQFAASNANIVHSYCHEDGPASAFSDPVLNVPLTTPPYGRTKPMPGRPLWMALEDPALINLGVVRHGPKTLMRLRVRDDGKSLFEVGRQLAYHFERPENLPSGHLEEIVRMVEAGGSVNTQFVRHNLERAFLIAYVEEEGVIVGNSSLKHPRQEYMDAVSRQSGIDLHDYLERGYTSVRPEYRGLGVGVKLLEGLTRRAGDHKIFSVIAESNVATQKMAMRNRTRRVATFYSQRANKEMSVWIPEWMLPEGIELPAQPDLGVDS